MIYVSFGLEKGGSTLTALLTKAILERAGHSHISFSAEARQDIKSDGSFARHGGQINNVNAWPEEVVNTLDRGVPADRIVMFRTHAAPSDAIRRAIESGRASCHVAIRDLRDIALSMLDTISRKEILGRLNRTGITLGDVTSTFDGMQINLDSMYQWLDMPGAIHLDYEQTAFNPTISIARICRHLGIEVSMGLHDEIFAEAAANPSGKRNVAMSKRHVREMSPEDQALVLERFADFYRRFYPHAGTAVLEEESIADYDR